MGPDNNQQHINSDANQPKAPSFSRPTNLPRPIDTAETARQQAESIYRQDPPNQLQPTNDGQRYRTHRPNVDWQQYHAAWQQYYQQYYYRYYAQQLLDQRSRQQIITDSDSAAQQPAASSRFRKLRNDLVAKVNARAQRFRRSNHFIPILSAVIVGLIFVFLQYNRVIAAQIEAFISPGSTVNVSDTTVIDPTTASVSSDPRLIIPKINVSVPVVYDVNTVDEKTIQSALDRGVVQYKLPGANSEPGQVGNTVILGHSSNDVFDSGNYKFAFVLIDRLDKGDLFYANYQGKRYIYKVTDKKVIDPTNWRILQQNNGKPTMVLVTCTPAGTSKSRLLVYGEQISPDPAAASAAPANKENANPATIPGNSQTFFERLWDIFF